MDEGSSVIGGLGQGIKVGVRSMASSRGVNSVVEFVTKGEAPDLLTAHFARGRRR